MNNYSENFFMPDEYDSVSDLNMFENHRTMYNYDMDYELSEVRPYPRPPLQFNPPIGRNDPARIPINQRSINSRILGSQAPMQPPAPVAARAQPVQVTSARLDEITEKAKQTMRELMLPHLP